MKWSTLTPFFAALGFVACGGLYVDLDVQGRSEVATGGTVSAEMGTGGAANGPPSTGGAQVVDAPSSGGSPPELTRGRFGDGMTTFEDRDMGGRPGNDGCGEREAFFVYEVKECLAASACLDPCDPASQAPLDISYRDDEGNSILRAPSECRTISTNESGREGQSFAVLPCDGMGKCPGELICTEGELGRSCFIRDIPWAPGCTEAYCVQGEGPRPPKLEAELCRDDAPCCGGRECSAEGICEPGCMADGRPCDDASPGATCCEGLVCKGGYCAKF